MIASGGLLANFLDVSRAFYASAGNSGDGDSLRPATLRVKGDHVCALIGG